jgi:deoxyadenosine/deoxycytidine kinase
MLEKTKIIKIRDEEFILDISKLTIANYLAMEIEKQRLSGNKYFEIATTYFKSTANAANLIDMIATFRVLIPELEKSIKVQYEMLNVIDTKELLKIYVKDVAPWYKEWMDEFSSPLEEDGDKD